MNGLRKLSLMAAMLVCTTLAAVAQKPNIHILATGGTIAGTGASARLLKQIILPDRWLSAHCWKRFPK